jgi:hypothetical protein
MKINEIVDKFMLPNVAFFVFIVFLIVYFIFLDEEGTFNEKFLQFGPGTNEKNTTKFLGMKIDSWKKVVLLYFVSFFSSLLTAYYQNVVGQGMHAYIWNPAVKEVPFSKFWTYVIITFEPFIYFFLNIIQFFTNLTMQLQFLIPQFIGSYIAQTPFDYRWLSKKKFKEV